VVHEAGRKFACWNIIERKDSEKALWSRVGTAFTNRDGSINVYLDSFPLGGKVQLRDDKDAKDQSTPPWQRRSRPAVTRIENDGE
jgi:hypothetical protein